MYPCSPHEVPQEFFIRQQLDVKPTRRTSWFTALSQLLKMPEPQVLHLVASTVTPKGLSYMAAYSQIQPFNECILVILNQPPSLKQGPLALLQGQFFSSVIPFSITYWRALKLKPPQHPLFPQSSEQSTSCCQERQMTFYLDRAKDSRMATALNAQQEAQLPWFFTGDTLPCEIQSIQRFDLGTTALSSLCYSM